MDPCVRKTKRTSLRPFEKDTKKGTPTKFQRHCGHSPVKFGDKFTHDKGDAQISTINIYRVPEKPLPNGNEVFFGFPLHNPKGYRARNNLPKWRPRLLVLVGAGLPALAQWRLQPLPCQVQEVLILLKKREREPWSPLTHHGRYQEKDSPSQSGAPLNTQKMFKEALAFFKKNTHTHTPRGCPK